MKAPVVDETANRLTAKPQVELAAGINEEILIEKVTPEEVTLIRRARKK
jgi:hypothetical protein